MHLIPSGHSRPLVKIVKKRVPTSSSIVEGNRTPGARNGEGEGEKIKNVGNEKKRRPNFAKVYPAWQGYRIDFRLQKIYRPISTRRIGFPPEQSEEIRQRRRAIWEKLAPNSSSLALDLLEGLQINTQTLDEVRDILAGKWNRSTNNFQNRWEWFRRRLRDLGFDEIQIRLVLGCEPAGETDSRDEAKNQCPDEHATLPDSALPMGRPLREDGIGDAETKAPAQKWIGPSALARLVLGPRVDDYRWFMNVVRGMWPHSVLKEDPVQRKDRWKYLEGLGLSAEQIEALSYIWPDQMWEPSARRGRRRS